MKDEIKEILERLERIDHKEYSGGFEFADSGSFDEDCRCFEERKKLANYITNLQEENNKFNGIIEMFKETNELLINQKYKLEYELDKLDEVRDKAIKYINQEIKNMPLNGCKQRLNKIKEILQGVYNNGN